MKFLLTLTVVVASAYGWVDWKDARVGSSSLPRTEGDAKVTKWKVVSNDDNLKIRWYKQKSRGFQVAFDNRQNLAGVRIAQKDKDLVEGYDGITKKSGTFELQSLQSTKFWVSTVFFANPDIFKNGGREMSDEDEVAMGLYVRRGGQWIKLDREGCDYADAGSVEQGCKPGYGLVFSDLKKNSTCASLSPFYQLLDPTGKGDTVAFGWLHVGKALPKSKAVSEASLKELFPESPSCLQAAAAKGKLRDITIYLSYSSSTKTTCPSPTGQWYRDSCQRKFRDMSVRL